MFLPGDIFDSMPGNGKCPQERLCKILLYSVLKTQNKYKYFSRINK